MGLQALSFFLFLPCLLSLSAPIINSAAFRLNLTKWWGVLAASELKNYAASLDRCAVLCPVCQP